MIPSDTSLDAEEVQLSLLRAMTPSERAMLAIKMSTSVIHASKRAIARAHPEFSPRDIELYFIELHHGKELADAVREYVRNRDDA